MAKIVKKTKKRKKIRLINFAVSFFLFSAVSYLSSALFLRTYNNSLSTQKQSIDSKIADLETQNDAVKVEIQTLSTRDRVDTIASDNGLSLDQNNIITITTTDSSSSN
ncbi:MAG: hypothetical protein LKF50_06640 [Solobacterium sp.]|jgi:cell division protein FtsL|nr:hypothetical protein [Solobacterium sp.]